MEGGGGGTFEHFGAESTQPLEPVVLGDAARGRPGALQVQRRDVQPLDGRRVGRRQRPLVVLGPRAAATLPAGGVVTGADTGQAAAAAAATSAATSDASDARGRTADARGHAGADARTDSRADGAGAYDGPGAGQGAEADARLVDHVTALFQSTLADTAQKRHQSTNPTWKLEKLGTGTS